MPNALSILCLLCPGVLAPAGAALAETAPAPPPDMSFNPATQPLDLDQLEAVVRAHAAARCKGEPRFLRGSIRWADADGDGETDLLLDWNVTPCAASGPLESCTAAGCGIEAFLSGSYDPERPVPALLGMTLAVEPGADGAGDVIVTTRPGSCPGSRDPAGCEIAHVWDGQNFVPLK